MSLSMFAEILFWIGIVFAFVGGIMIVASFAVFKRKIMKTPMYEEVKLKRNKQYWRYILFFTGIALIFISYYLAVR